MMFRKLIMTRGLPGSGKSTWAEVERVKLESQGLKVMVSNKDEIRKALSVSGWKWSPDAEKDVIKIQNQQIKDAFSHGINIVIVADTNFGSHKDRLEGLAQHCEAEFDIKDFTDVPLQICIERDARRENSVGDTVIREMANKYLVPTIVRYVPPIGKNPAVICDLDGTLALKGDRSPFDYSKVGLDAVNDPIARILWLCYRDGYRIIYVSGRDDSCMDATKKWLADNNLPMQDLFMRKTGDHRKDYIVKLELFNEHIRDHYNVRFVLDDRDQVVKMWRELGLTCLQVNYGNF